MYQIAERYPEMVKYPDADGYLERMWQTQSGLSSSGHTLYYPIY